jgi:hypothetical protein
MAKVRGRHDPMPCQIGGLDDARMLVRNGQKKPKLADN